VPALKAQDEGEIFDLYSRDGAPLGRQKSRAAVHRDGDWHRSVHIWVWGMLDREPHLVFQRRARGKDTWPGALDVAVTGHARAGESIEATLREADEEIGLAVQLADLARLGRRRREDRRPGSRDNELQEIFARVAPAEIAALAPSPEELEAIVALPFAETSRVLISGGEAMGQRLYREGTKTWFVAERLSGGDFVPAPDGYYAKAQASLATLLAGGIPEAWDIG
jgi:isopentenyldiphosphate isomerase